MRSVLDQDDMLLLGIVEALRDDLDGRSRSVGEAEHRVEQCSQSVPGCGVVVHVVSPPGCIYRHHHRVLTDNLPQESAQSRADPSPPAVSFASQALIRSFERSGCGW